MTFWAARAPAATSLQTFLLLILLASQPANAFPCNVGTVVFGPVDALACCLDKEKYAALVFRQVLNDILAVPLQNAKGDAYICAFISFVHASARAAVAGAPPAVARPFVTALLDVAGGYLRSYLLPVSREAFYAGNLRFLEARKLFNLYDDIKAYLHTDGQGWTPPLGQYGILHNVRSLDISVDSSEVPFSCDNFLFNSSARSSEASSRNTARYYAMPIPFFDDNQNPGSVALPLRYGALRSITTSESSYIILAHYVRSIRCLKEQATNVKEFFNYNKNFRRWIITRVLPRLGDERWYPAFGGILRVLKKTGEYIHNKDYMPSSSTKCNKKETRKRRESDRGSKMASDRTLPQNLGSVVEAVANGLIPIDVDIIQKLMYPSNEQNFAENPEWEISVFPGTVNHQTESEINLESTNSFENSSRTESSISPTVVHLDRLRNRNYIELHGNMIYENQKAESAFITSKSNPTLDAEDHTLSTKATENVTGMNKDYEDDETLEEKPPMQNINVGVDTDNIHRSVVKDHLGENRKMFELKESTPVQTTALLEEIYDDENDDEEQDLKIKLNLGPKSQLTNAHKSSVTEGEREKNEKYQNAFGIHPIKLSYMTGSAENPSLMSIKRGKILKDKLLELSPHTSITEATENESDLTEIIKTSVGTHSQLEENTSKQHTVSISITDQDKLKIEKHSKALPSEHSMELTSAGHGSPDSPVPINHMPSTIKPSLSPNPKGVPMNHKPHSFPESEDEEAQSESTTKPSSSTNAEKLPGVDASLYTSLFGVSLVPHKFENITDGCVHRTWDGVHAPAPLVSRLLVDVLQSPAFNADLLLCHILLGVLLWLVLLCACVGQSDCRAVLRERHESDFHRRLLDDDAHARRRNIQQTYYSLGGELPPDAAAAGGGRRSGEEGSQEETTPLTERASDTASRAASLVAKIRGSQSEFRLAAGGSMTSCQKPMRCLFPMQHFVDTEAEDSDECSEEELFNRTSSRFPQ